ncbi:hypothetical protein KW790_02345 [Candidatus Parcubacteria bacterium]|nr:hypothetical protein [Candidatus Parcubacteria bacterium]
MNEDLFLDGKQYTSVGRASERTGYASDYLSQLCRGKKIPARMVGRTWYLDFSALRDHQINKAGKSKKKEDLHESNTSNTVEKLPDTSVNAYGSNLNSSATSLVLDLPRSHVFESKFKYEYKKPNPVSILMKKHDAFLVNSKKVNNVRHRVLTNVIMVLLILGIGYSVLLNTKIIQSQSVSASVVDTVKNGWNNVVLLFKKSPAVATTPAVNSQGIVIFPESSQSEQSVETVKNAFSDQVNVAFDESGSSGIVTPIFRPGEETKNYVFVMVPISSKQK